MSFMRSYKLAQSSATYYTYIRYECIVQYKMITTCRGVGSNSEVVRTAMGKLLAGGT